MLGYATLSMMFWAVLRLDVSPGLCCAVLGQAVLFTLRLQRCAKAHCYLTGQAVERHARQGCSVLRGHRLSQDAQPSRSASCRLVVQSA